MTQSITPPSTPYSSLRGLARIDLAKAIPLSGPLTIYVEPTNICNFKCVYCPESFDSYKDIAGGHFQLSLDDFKKVAKQIKDLATVKTLNFYMMGEPFVNKQLPQFISIAKTEAIAERVIVTSNGTLVRPHLYPAICDSQLDYLRVSIYGGNESAHASNTQSPFRLSQIKDNVLGLKRFRDSRGQRDPFIYVKMIGSPHENENRQFKQLFSEAADEVFLEPVMNWNDPEEGDLSGQAKGTPMSQQYFSATKAVCPFPFYTLVIHSDLRVSVCCVDWNKQAVVGNLRDESLADIWKGERLRTFQLRHLQRRRHELAGCKNCTYLHTAPDNIDSLNESILLKRNATANTGNH
jgi:radical SAM protein with 4Fe4S-binding SPASM domain